MCLWLCAYKCRWPRRPDGMDTPRELDTPRSRVTGSCEPLDVDARNQIFLLHESNIYF